MSMPVKVAVFYQGETELVCRLALAAATGVEDADGEVRLRSLGRPVPSATIYARPEFVRVLRALERTPDASPADLAWADAALFGTATPYGMTLDPLTRFIDATVPLWRVGTLAEKVYGGFTAATAAHGRPGRRLVSLTDVFHHWGGIIIPLEGRDPIGGQPGERDGISPLAAHRSPVEAELAAARRQGRRATEIVRALKARHVRFADVA
ncbi:MAG TPA: hypothetical protein VFS08_03235 [Gemmatimonadaceae bacterium]|nr:hypothetical protein [Gemmatimonadaceae bacterium]